MTPPLTEKKHAISDTESRTPTCQWVPRPVSPGGGAASGPWVPPETRNRSGPAWHSAHGGEKGTAPSLLLHSSLCPHKELQSLSHCSKLVFIQVSQFDQSERHRYLL